MPTPGLSLVGFLDQPAALEHFRRACKPVNDSDAALIAEWNAAKALLGAPIVGAGNPATQPIPVSHHGYILQVEQAHNIAPGVTFALVEIEKLLAFQTTISTAQSARHCGTLGVNPPTIDELLQICLPINPPLPDYVVTPGQNSILITGNDLNLVAVLGGHFRFNPPTGAPASAYPPVGGIVIGARLPLVHVVRFGGRHYLHNGFHRVYGVARAGATYVPCLIRDAVSEADAGINPPGTFGAAMLASNDPPTLGHYVQGRAYTVPLRVFARAMHVSWGEHNYPTE